MNFISNMEDIRRRARQKIEEGAVTENYPLDPNHATSILNEVLATEIVCTLRYRFHYFMATGIHSSAVAEEFLEHANEEQEHADRVARRIKQLGTGNPRPDFAVSSGDQHPAIRQQRRRVRVSRRADRSVRNPRRSSRRQSSAGCEEDPAHDADG